MSTRQVIFLLRRSNNNSLDLDELMNAGTLRKGSTPNLPEA